MDFNVSRKVFCDELDGSILLFFSSDPLIDVQSTTFSDESDLLRLNLLDFGGKGFCCYGCCIGQTVLHKDKGAVGFVARSTRLGRPTTRTPSY